MDSTEYAEAVQLLKPDIVLSLADVVEKRPGLKRLEKMGDRTQAWLKDLIAAIEDVEEGDAKPALFAPILPIEAEQQSYYLDALADDFSKNISGLVLYNSSSVLAVPESLVQMPRILTADIRSPHEILDAVAVGIDIFTLPFIGAATDAGIALDFFFSTELDDTLSQARPLGIDVWLVSHATNTNPLQKNCDCYTCTNHHRAYVQHLLSAKEMLGWTLLQIHNYHVVDRFFASIRQRLRDGSFDEGREVFSRSYELKLPGKTGQGPR